MKHNAKISTDEPGIGEDGDPPHVVDSRPGFSTTWPYHRLRSGFGVIATTGRFVSGSYANYAGSRDYKLFVPSAYTGQSLPLIVMLHGCTQHPDDFAAGTRMNVLGEQNNFFVLYPAQTESANGSRCWNWFEALNQRRNMGEPSIIAGMTRDIIDRFQIDGRRVFIAGLSSGGAMAATVATLYPELYAAVGIHSGLPHASARNLSSAIAAMKNGARKQRKGSISSAMFFAQKRSPPTIVFHGDRDTTVHPSNGEQIIAQSVSAARDPISSAASQEFRSIVGTGKVSNGHAYTHNVHRDASGRVIAEHWIVHGAGHAWSGGSRLGSYTDPRGPDAAREMLRFFLDRM